jgi:hypothetical protein
MNHPNIRRHGVMVSRMRGQDLMVAVDAIFFQIDIMKKDWISMAGRPSTFEINDGMYGLDNKLDDGSGHSMIVSS